MSLWPACVRLCVSVCGGCVLGSRCRRPTSVLFTDHRLLVSLQALKHTYHQNPTEREEAVEKRAKVSVCVCCVWVCVHKYTKLCALLCVHSHKPLLLYVFFENTSAHDDGLDYFW